MAQTTMKKRRQIEKIKDVLAVKLWLPQKLANLVNSILQNNRILPHIYTIRIKKTGHFENIL